MDRNPSRTFHFGTATSAYQVEGWNVFADWWMEEQNGRLPLSMEAVDHWHRWEEDFLLMASAGFTAYRFSISWPRVEPHEGQVDRKALETYRTMLGRLHELGITPVVTLHHFVNPYWFYRQGGWLRPESPVAFQKFVRVVLQHLSDLVSIWIPFNEPVVYAYHGFMEGIWPPFIRDLRKVFRVLRHMLLAHRLAVEVIREYCPDARVGIAKHLVDFRPAGRGLHEKVARRVHRMFNQDVLDILVHGTMRMPYGREHLGPSLDFIGVNYYMTRTLRFSLRAPGQFFTREVETESRYPNTMGWTMDAAGFENVLRFAGRYGLPIWITENGIATDEGHEDPVREMFIRDHLQVVRRLREEGLPVEGYLYWSLLDNYEWAEGFKKRFGLVEVNRTTLERSPRTSLMRFPGMIRELFG